MKRSEGLDRPDTKLGILLPGLGAVATTTIAGVLLARRGLGLPIGSLTQCATLPLDERTEGHAPLLRDALPLAALDQLVFGAWDIFPDDAHAAALHAGVIEPRHLEPIREELAAIVPMKGAFLPEYVRRLQGTHVKPAASRALLVEALREDIRGFKRDHGCDRAVAIWCGSTETLIEPTAVHQSIEAFEGGLRSDDPAISSSQLYAWACLKERVAYANGAPNPSVEFPAALELAREMRVPVAGKDFKTGQTLLKTILAPGLRARMLGVSGWFSTNILGNRDGEVLDDPDSCRAKEASKLGVLDHLLDPTTYPALYGDLHHRVSIHYYPPRGDAKESWDSVDLFGWLGYPMQLKIDFLCRDSILAAPLVLDLALLLDLAQRAGRSGIQAWLGFYFKSPMSAPGTHPAHDLFDQLAKLEGTMRAMLAENALGGGE